MNTNLNMTQSTPANVPAFPFLPASTPLRSNRVSQPTLSPAEPANHLKRDLAWRIAPNLLISFKYAWAGVRYAFITQRNFRIHTMITVLAIALGIFLHVSGVEMAVVSLTCALVMVLELLNTALESVVDLTVGHSYHELAKIAKDCAAGAVLISACAALFVASFILLPPLSTLLLAG